MPIPVKQFMLSNSTNDIVEIDFDKDVIRYFADPFGRDSSGTPDWQHSFYDFRLNNELVARLKPLFFPQDWQSFTQLIGLA